MLALICCGVLAPAVRASTYDVTPISLTLTPKMTSGMLAITNRGSEAVRFSVTAMAWDQSAEGEMVLSPTKDLVFFPAMFNLNPGEARNVRVGSSLKPGAVEKTYRLFIQELPPLAKSQAEAASQVRVVSKMGVPVFVEGTSAQSAATVSNMSFAAPKVSFVLKNTGNAHYRPEKITIEAKDEKGKVVHSQEVKSWYLLAGRSQRYEVSLPPELCGTMRSIELALKTANGGPINRAKLGNATCTR
jgi:fimbrial chaperone protein